MSADAQKRTRTGATPGYIAVRGTSGQTLVLNADDIPLKQLSKPAVRKSAAKK